MFTMPQSWSETEREREIATREQRLKRELTTFSLPRSVSHSAFCLSNFDPTRTNSSPPQAIRISILDSWSDSLARAHLNLILFPFAPCCDAHAISLCVCLFVSDCVQQGGGVTTNFRTKPNPLLQYTATFPAASSLSHHAHPPPPSQHQRHHSNPQMQAASMGMYVAQAQGSGAAGMMPSTLGYGSAATMAPHPHPPHHPPQPQPMQLAPGQLSIPSAMQMTGPSSGGGGGGVLLPTFPLTDARRSMLHYAAVSRADHSGLARTTFSPASLTLFPSLLSVLCFGCDMCSVVNVARPLSIRA